MVTYDYDGKTVLVTGGGSGIGRASASAFSVSGAQVAIADISEENGRRAVEELRAAGGTAEYFHVDVADEESVISMVASIVSRFGRIDVAHNNAGIEANIVPLADLPSDNWRRVVDVNLSSVFYCLKAQIPHMVANGGGAIVNTASASGLIGGYHLAAYTATKHGVVGLTKAAAMDYAERNVRINAICPGAVDTPFLEALPQRFRDRLIFGTPIGRLGRPAEMARAVLWLCSDDASYVTGHAMAVDGGVVLGGTGTRFDDLLDG